MPQSISNAYTYICHSHCKTQALGLIHSKNIFIARLLGARHCSRLWKYNSVLLEGELKICKNCINEIISNSHKWQKVQQMKQ